MSDLLIHDVRALQPGEGILADAVRVRDGKIAALGAAACARSKVASKVDGGGRLLTPGLIDVQTHGMHTYLYERSVEDLCAGLSVLGRYGTTCVLPTLYTVMRRATLGQLEQLAEALSRAVGAAAPGFHLEGPFLALTGAGADTVPGDVGLLEELLDAAHGRVAVMSVSPEVPNIIPVIERLRARGVRVFITHTRATAEQTLAAVDAGATHATHFYDVFPVPEETEPGVRPVGAVEVFLADPRCTVDFIGDGVHVPPIAVKAALAAKGPEGVALITDANIGAGLDAGVYATPWGFDVKVAPDDAARIHGTGGPRDGLLAGSALTMDRGMRNVMAWLDLPLAQLWELGTRTPARILGLRGKGVMEVGADADLVLWDEHFRAQRTWVGGKQVYP